MKVKNTTWHYRLNKYIAEKSLVPNWFIDSRMIPTLSCDYWAGLIKYFMLQIPALLFLGVGAGLILMATIVSWCYFATFGIIPTLEIADNNTSVLLTMGVGFNFTIMIALMCYGFIKLGNISILNNDIDISFISESIKAFRDKYCFKLEFIDADGQPLPVKIPYDIRPFGYIRSWGWGHSSCYDQVSIGNGEYLTVKQFKEKYPDFKILFSPDVLYTQETGDVRVEEWEGPGI